MQNNDTQPNTTDTQPAPAPSEPAALQASDSQRTQEVVTEPPPPLPIEVGAVRGKRNN